MISRSSTTRVRALLEKPSQWGELYKYGVTRGGESCDIIKSAFHTSTCDLITLYMGDMDTHELGYVAGDTPHVSRWQSERTMQHGTCGVSQQPGSGVKYTACMLQVDASLEGRREIRDQSPRADPTGDKHDQNQTIKMLYKHETCGVSQ